MKVKCKLCETLVNEDDLEVCKSCREKAETFENATKIGNCYRKEVFINEFYTHCFCPQDIEDILYGAFKGLPEEEQKRLIKEYCEDDILYFTSWLVRKCRQGK